MAGMDEAVKAAEFKKLKYPAAFTAPHPLHLLLRAAKACAGAEPWENVH